MLRRLGLGRRPVVVADPALSLWDVVPTTTEGTEESQEVAEDGPVIYPDEEAFLASLDEPQEQRKPRATKGKEKPAEKNSAKVEGAYLVAWLAWRTDELGNARPDIQPYEARMVPRLVRLAKAQGLWPLLRVAMKAEEQSA